jgi:hypothetical protein
MMHPDSTYQMNIETFSIIWKPMEIADSCSLKNEGYTNSSAGDNPGGKGLLADMGPSNSIDRRALPSKLPYQSTKG